MACAKYGIEQDGVHADFDRAAHVQLTLNVESAESETLMSYHGISLTLDGSWRSSRCGVCSERSTSSIDCGVLCVLSLLHGEPTNARSFLANALNLESYER
eukprot:TRINITY_DN9938_c0_g1_i1.p1 TRINITY_DN9938_c0_g1~~TRINITY_DN9938_c0_g1_i1.p1  ORF type:complete len:101 (-),score=5.93 TRINITY_DN9938_c0_g1_i1:120-422(-)